MARLEVETPELILKKGLLMIKNELTSVISMKARKEIKINM